MRRPLVLSVLIAVIALVVSAPSASAVSFHSATNPEYLQGQQVESPKFRFPSTHFGQYFLEPICALSATQGTATALTLEQIQLFPIYSNCTTQLLPVAIDTNGCSYTVSPVSSGFGFKGNLKLTCRLKKSWSSHFSPTLRERARSSSLPRPRLNRTSNSSPKGRHQEYGWWARQKDFHTPQTPPPASPAAAWQRTTPNSCLTSRSRAIPTPHAPNWSASASNRSSDAQGLEPLGR